MTEVPICPCDKFTHPQVIFNPPGRSAIAYRYGDYTSFRRALLLPLKDTANNLVESELTNWNPGAEDDLAVQMMEWWAYLADILTFYNERVANESYLRTADLPESVQRLIRILGYRPRPGIGARGVVAALVNNSKLFILPQGFQIQSKPGPGKQPQIFELDVDTTLTSPDAIAADPVPNTSLLNADGSVLLQGSVTTVKSGDKLLLLEKDWNGSNTNYALATVTTVHPEKDPRGKTNTRITFAHTPNLPSHAQVQNYRLLKSSQSTHLYQYPTNHVIATGHLHLESLKRDLKVGDPMLLENPNQSPDQQLVSVSEYTEYLWYANAPDPDNPSTPPTASNVPAIPILHTRPFITPLLSNDFVTRWDADRTAVLVNFAYQDVGQLMATPATTLQAEASSTPNQTQLALTAVSPALFPAGDNLSLQVEDALSLGISAQGDVGLQPSASIQLAIATPPELLPSLTPPLRVLFDLLPVSRGETVANELLGSGDASIPGQEFVLQKFPLTYLLSGDSTSGDSYKSTLRVWVNGIEWQEVPSFYGQSSDAPIFVTREDEKQQTIVQFGDGINGARLSTGIDNVVARYRYGSGKEAPDAGSLNVIVKPYPNLKAIRNPVTVGGGDDPEPPEQIRHYAPMSVLTFGRAVSGDDYEAIAALTPGVSRAKVYWTWDATQQRSLVKLYVGDDNSAVDAAKIALSGAADPNRPVVVELAQPLKIKLTLTLQIAANRIPETVLATARNALIHPDTGLFGINVVQIGQAIYQSQVFATCLKVPGVLAVHDLQFFYNPATGFLIDPHYRHDPGEGKFYQLLETNLILNWEVG